MFRLVLAGAEVGFMLPSCPQQDGTSESKQNRSQGKRASWALSMRMAQGSRPRARMAPLGQSGGKAALWESQLAPGTC